MQFIDLVFSSGSDTVADGVVKSGSFASSIAPVEDRLLFMDAVDGSIPTCVVEHRQALQLISIHSVVSKVTDSSRGAASGPDASAPGGRLR